MKYFSLTLDIKKAQSTKHKAQSIEYKMQASPNYIVAILQKYPLLAPMGMIGEGYHYWPSQHGDYEWLEYNFLPDSELEKKTNYFVTAINVLGKDKLDQTGSNSCMDVCGHAIDSINAGECLEIIRDLTELLKWKWEMLNSQFNQLEKDLITNVHHTPEYDVQGNRFYSSVFVYTNDEGNKEVMFVPKLERCNAGAREWDTDEYHEHAITKMLLGVRRLTCNIKCASRLLVSSVHENLRLLNSQMLRLEIGAIHDEFDSKVKATGKSDVAIGYHRIPTIKMFAQLPNFKRCRALQVVFNMFRLQQINIIQQMRQYIWD